MTDYTETALRCLELYGLRPTRIDFIRHNENITFYVELSCHHTPVVLRLHKPMMSGLVKDFRTPRAVKSALEWMMAIADDTAIAVQKPIRSKEGELVGKVKDHNEETIHCSILEWIDGIILDQEHRRAESHIRAFGTVVAELHNHSSYWSRPKDFWRPSYGNQFLEGVAARIEPGLESDLFTKNAFDQIKLAIDKIISFVESARDKSGHWGLVHADLQGGNLLVHGDEIRPIDFTMCGWSPYLFEIGMAVSCLQAKWRQCFLASYEAVRPLETSALIQMEAGAIQGILAAFSYHISNPPSHEWIARRVPIVAGEYCGKFLNDQHFLFDM